MSRALTRTQDRGGLAGSSAGGDVVRCGAEIVELSERFYRGSFLGITALVGVAAVAALVLLPLRAGLGGVPVAGVIGAGVLVVATPLAIWRTESLYRALRGRLYAEVGVVLFAAALVAAVFPLRSQLWWPSCTLLTLVAVIAPIGRVLGYCVAVLAINLLAHVLSGDLGRTPAVSIIGLWIGYIFWALMVAAVTDQLAAHLMRLNSRSGPPRTTARRVVSWTADWAANVGQSGPVPGANLAGGDSGSSSRREEPSRHHSASASDELVGDAADLLPEVVLPVDGRLGRLTARQLQVLALLADGLRYREVAACLSISDGQVQRHVARAVARVGVSNAAELVAVAVSEGLVPPPAARAIDS
ncbi:MAG: response regulator transcription factor [Solirubrobacteraceae bacterium]